MNVGARATAGRTRALAPLADHSARSDACEEGIVGCSAPAAEKSSLSSWGSTTNLGRMDVPNWTWSTHRRRTPLYGTSSGSAGACEREGRDPRHVLRVSLNACDCGATPGFDRTDPPEAHATATLTQISN